MNYEIVSTLRPGTDNWKNQKARAEKNHSKVITLLPDPFLLRYKKEEYDQIINVVDYVTKRTYDAQRSLYFDKAPTVDGSEIYMNPDGVITIIKNGVKIATMRTFPNSRRLVQDITYVNTDGTKDFVEEYTFDGQLFSRISYFEDGIREIDFVNNDEEVCLRFFFYEGAINLVTVEDPKKHAVIERYDNLLEFQKAQVQKIVTEKDTVGITYLGVELDVLNGTSSTNTLYLEESAFDGDEIKGNLKLIMDDNIKYVQKAVVKHDDYQKMLDQKLNVTKVEYVD